MSKPVNLNKVRKDRARKERRAQADRNAVAFGRSGADKQRDKAENEKSIRRLDDHRRET
ncbi:DUF4169 family protein [uncultured Roseobacter sp.]|uniref:DUF4169 family protein n=1 Tax=uncultured Roseobacter sp. TaxID=114847 RepID=UPI0026106411|nr:DUF4169 family protein [uncultured Roseobacter sp.]